MLFIYTKQPDNPIEAIDSWFRRNKQNAWFNDPFVKEIILGIDKSVAVEDDYIKSPVFGTIGADRLSTGCKAVITMYVQSDRPVWATSCGNNCAKYIVEVSKKKDVSIWLAHHMNFGIDFEAVFAESEVRTHTNHEYNMEMFRLHEKRREESVTKG